MTRRRDAVLALLVLLAVCLAVVLTDTRPSVVPAVAGALAVVLAEVVLGRYERAVRTWWEQPLTQSIALVVALVGVAGGAALAPTVALWAAFGSVVAYLVLLGLVSASVVPPPSTWGR